jgi:mono/diheme cytochrome c family protein
MVGHQDSAAAEGSSSETYLGRHEGLLSALTVVALAALVFSFVGFVRAGSAGKGPANALPAALGADGKAVYSSKCASCHGPSGGGGVGPKLSAGAVVTTFTNPVDHVRWVMLGSTNGAAVYEKAGKKPVGGMPTFGGTITITEVVEAVLYERQNLSGHPIADDAAKWAELRSLATEFADKGVTEADIEAILTRIATEAKVTIPSKS